MVASHVKKANKRYRRLLPALAMLALTGGVLTLLARTAFFTPYRPPGPADQGAVMTPAQTGQAQALPTAEALPPAPRERVYSPDLRYDGRHAVPKPDLRTWGVDTLVPEAELHRCRFAAGSGALLLDYTWGEPAPESTPVEDDFFADTVFIGNSLEQGFMIYSGCSTADMFATQSITVTNIFYEKAVNIGGGEYITILDAMGRKTYEKVYIMLGLNEINYREEDFSRQYGRLLDRIREIQPTAELYLQSMTPVTARQSASGSVFNNERIHAYNGLIQDIAREKRAHYIYVYESLADEEGNLPAGASFDGIHPYQKYYIKWYDYLKAHTVVEVRK